MSRVPVTAAMRTEAPLILAGEDVRLRPIRPADAGMEAEFIRGLSAQAKHYRFMGGVNELSHDEMSRMCDVDGEHSMAFVATIDRGGREVEIGVSRYVAGAKSDAREFAVTVADEWQRRGLGTLLMNRLIEAARSHGVKELCGVGLVDNTAMIALAAGLGMSVGRDPGNPPQAVYRLPV